ncbi:hypothetical protein OE749_12400 [Aestuariibacter sp. AA17]|uniref:Uncharacterized protein n=1 Tax=Fluctibacter corallii TaxID=2984329 RepID=A0ABT3AB17_9ALTE|nr:hypothetical protein [Aestuariibacter sp. AA17]MCV2885496.1 hypothetical protein [Aestuariibacter sp. AA17]
MTSFEFDQSLLADLRLNGFENLKKNKFVNVTNDLLFLIEICISRKDVFVWYGCFPLTEKDIWLDAVVVGGRFPTVEEKKSLDDQITLTLRDGLTKAFSEFEKLNTLEKLQASISKEAKPYFQYVKGICLSTLERYSEANRCFDVFLNSGLKGEQFRITSEMVELIKADAIKPFPEENRIKNIKKLRLSKFLK